MSKNIVIARIATLGLVAACTFGCARNDEPAAPGNSVATKATSSRQEASREAFSNSIGMKLIRIPAGEFLMGSAKSDNGAREDEMPRRRVRITRSFYMGVYEVTQGQYERIMKTNPQATMVWLGDADRAIVLNSDGDLILIRLAPSGYQEQSRVNIIGRTWAHPAYAGNCAFARSDTEIVCVLLPLAGAGISAHPKDQ